VKNTNRNAKRILPSGFLFPEHEKEKHKAEGQENNVNSPGEWGSAFRPELAQ
jgi:hypothetical protein